MTEGEMYMGLVAVFVAAIVTILGIFLVFTILVEDEE